MLVSISTVKVRGLSCQEVTSWFKQLLTKLLNSFAGIPWFLSVRINEIDGIKYLSIYIHHDNRLHKNHWIVVATFELRLLKICSKTDKVCGDVVMVGEDRTFVNSNQSNGVGCQKFIPVEKLRSDSFIQKDTIKIRCYLSIKGFEKITD